MKNRLIIFAVIFLLVTEGGFILMANLIFPTDTLAQGYPKINDSIMQSDQALNTANIAFQRTKETQELLDNIILESGTSGAETVQARGTFPLLNDRLNNSDQEIDNLSLQVNKTVDSAGFYNLNNLKSKRIVPLTFNSDTGHFSTFSGDLACNGIMVARSSGTSGYVITNGNRTANSVKFNMPIGVIIGDSIAEGHPALHGRLHQSDGSVNLSIINNTVGQIAYHVEQNIKYRVYNHGIGGQRLDQVRARWERDVLAHTVGTLTPTQTLSKKPSFVILICGINDVFLPRSYESMIADAEYMIDSAISNDIYPIVFNIGPHYLMDDTKLALVKQYNAWLKAKADSTPNMTLIDFYGYANDTANDGKPKSGIFTDGVHPTMRTYEDLARKITNEAFVESKPPVFVNYINISTAMDINSKIDGGQRPTSVLLYINDVPVKYALLPNTPNQVIEIPSVNYIMDTVTLEPSTAEIPYEFPTNTADYIYISEVYLSDKNIYPTGLISDYESIIQPFSSVSGIARFYGAIPNASVAGQFTFASTAGVTNCVGVFVRATTATGYVCTKGLCIIKPLSTVYNGDLLITSTGGNFERSTSPAAGAVVAKVIKSDPAFTLVYIK